MSLVAAGKSDARLQAYELITVVHSLSASLAQTADHNPNLVSLDVVEEKVLSLQNSGHECSAICRWLLQPDTIEAGGEGSMMTATSVSCILLEAAPQSLSSLPSRKQ